MKHVAVLTTEEQAVGKYELSCPLVDGGKKLDVLYFRSPTVGDIEEIENAARQGETKGTRMLIAQLAGLLPEAVQRMKLSDFESIREALPDFLSEQEWKAIQKVLEGGIAVSALSSSLDSLQTGKNG